MDKKLEKAFNVQLNKELYSEYLYLAMKGIFAELKLTGFVNWMDVQVQEERAHAMGMYDYVITRNNHLEFEAIDKPEINGTTPLAIFEQILEHEEFVTASINELMDVAEEVRDRAAVSFLDWYLKEQVEEESNVGTVLAKLRLIGDDKQALFNLDKELATRTFVAPVIG